MTPLMSNPPNAVFEPHPSLSLVEQLTCGKSLFHNLEPNFQRYRTHSLFAPEVIIGSQSLGEMRGQSQRWSPVSSGYRTSL